MKPGITFENIWHDEDMYEFRISSSDGVSVFIHDVYVGYGTFDETIAGLDAFKSQVYGGIYDIEFGSFGPEYASGAFHARLHFQNKGKIFVSISAQSEFGDFGKKNIASEAKLYFVTEPALLDNFIASLKSLNNGDTNSVYLEIA
ncbi:hypothetical protein [Shewanella carassii]|uniref:hypothetical protein n=1 Tax=Shewanella carassii TaxID=1987584 RepID=UPI001C824E72|nr:hypothetical protein [Shewanella carassii]